MKLKFDIKNKNADFEADIERLVEKGMEHHEKDWKDKFNTKHSAKKEMLEIKHKHKMDLEESNKTKKNWFQKIQEEKRKIKELEIEERKRQEEEKKKQRQIKIISTIILGIVGGIMYIGGALLGSASGDPNSGWYSMELLGLFLLFGIAFIWVAGIDNDKKKKK